MHSAGSSELLLVEVAGHRTDPVVGEETPATGAGIVLGTVLIFVALILGSAMLARERRWGPRPRRR